MLIYRNAIKDDSDASIIQSDINELFKWSETWLLKFHPDKCKVLPVLNKIKQYVKNKYIMRKYEGGITTLENVDVFFEI
jgi:phosphoenolpyruvate carboxylase